MKYKKKIALLKANKNKNKSFIINNESTYNRLYNAFIKKSANLNELSQRIFLEESKKYTYFPEINQYDIIFKNYYIIHNNIYDTYNNNENKVSINTLESNSNIECMDNSSIEKKNENNNINYSSLKEDNNNNIKDNEICNIYTIEENYNNSIIDKKLPSLSELEIEEEKINKTISNMDHYRKIKLSIHKKKKSKNIKNRKFDTIHNSKSINNREQKINIIDCDNLISFPSPTLHKEFDKNQLISNTSYGNFEHNEFQNKSFARSTNIIPHARFILSPNNLRNASENCVPISNNTYSYGRKEILNNHFIPKSTCSLE